MEPIQSMPHVETAQNFATHHVPPSPDSVTSRANSPSILTHFKSSLTQDSLPATETERVHIRMASAFAMLFVLGWGDGGKWWNSSSVICY